MKWIVEVTNNRTGQETKASNYFHESIEEILNVQNLIEREIIKLRNEGTSYLVKVFLMYDSGIKESLKPLPEWIIKILNPTKKILMVEWIKE